ncbi:FAD-dependent oxidoreductase [Actinomadura rubrisoli]|uniref:FAD-binding protein n=1 Tax=Actinomadura rubrisoli TaxID=2530368 RepID=A0A4R5AWC7_9ACTN|nr:FAD-dependent monooxygenase [Actinomadura rubrisoli]TDD76825.1 FAD-binding protein [Actinomadura rubrisoli]
MAPSKTAEVIGAGLAGLTAATALAQRGWTVRLHERETEIRAIGAGIYVWGNGLATLEALGLYERAADGAHVGPVLETRDHRDRVVEEVPINGPGQARVLTIMRDHLINTLIDGAAKAGVDIRTGSEVVEASPDGGLVTRSGATSRADVVLAADGVNSRIRRQYDIVAHRAAARQGATRLTVPRRPGFVPDRDQSKYIEYFSGRRRVLYTPSSETSLYVALVADEDDRPASRIPVDTAAWIRCFPHLEALLGACAGVPGRWDTFQFLTLTRWSMGRLAFLGDAAHAQPPYLGQGGGCAMMSALGLADALSGSDAPVDQRLRDWEYAERPTIEHTQRWSHRLGRLNYVPDAARTPLLRGSRFLPRLGASRLRAALTVPTGAGRFAGSAAGH